MPRTTFDNAAAAVRFADGLLNDPHVRLCMQDGVGGDGYEDVKSLAETISVELSRVSKPAGPLFRFVHGRYTETLWLADHLAHKAWEEPPLRGRTMDKCRDLAVLVMAEKRVKQFGKRITITLMAKTMGITRKVFYDRWFSTYSSILKETDFLLDQADRALSDRLEGLQIIE